MLLSDLYPTVLVESLSSIEDRLASAKKSLAELKAKSSTHQQSGQDPRYADLLKKLQAAVAAAKYDLIAFTQRASREANARDFANNIAIKKAAETPSEQKARLSKAMSSGHATSKKIGKDMASKAAAVHAVYTELSDGGKHRVTADDIAHKLGDDTTPGNISRWLRDHSEFRKTAQMMGR
jgi:hypothetical protein